MSGLNVSTDRMVLIFECKVKNIEGFKVWSRDRAAKYVYDLSEENSISYEWHISNDGADATLIESFVDSDAMIVSLANHSASPLASEVAELIDFKSILCLGNAKKDAIETLSAWGAQFRSHHSGYNREVIGPR